MTGADAGAIVREITAVAGPAARVNVEGAALFARAIGVAEAGGGGAAARGATEGFPCQLLRTSTVAAAGRALAPDVAPADSPGSPGSPDPRGAGSSPPSSAAARPWSRL